MSGQEVGRETNREGDRSDDDVGEELDQRQERVSQPPRRGSDDASELEIAEEAVPLDALVVVGDPGDGCQNQGESDAAVRREVEARDDLEEVPDEYEEEESGEERQEPVRI